MHIALYCFTYINSFGPPNNSVRQVLLLCHFIDKEFETESHTASKWQGQDLNLSYLHGL